MLARSEVELNYRRHGAVVIGVNGSVGRVADGGMAGEWALWEAELIQHLAHERRRLRLVAAVLISIGVLLMVAHVLDHADGRSRVPLGLDDLIAGYPIEFSIAVAACAIWLRARVLAAVSRQPPVGGVRGGLVRRWFNAI